MALYSDIVMDHFMHPRNVGEIPDADGVGQVGNAKCGDIMKMYLKIKDNVIQDVKFETFGCGSAIASSSMATEMIKGKTVDEALAVTNRQVVDALGGDDTGAGDAGVEGTGGDAGGPPDDPEGGGDTARVARDVTSVTVGHLLPPPLAADTTFPFEIVGIL